jgi:hypothetical protein
MQCIVVAVAVTLHIVHILIIRVLIAVLLLIADAVWEVVWRTWEYPVPRVRYVVAVLFLETSWVGLVSSFCGY